MRSYFIGCVFFFLFISCKSQLSPRLQESLVEIKSRIYMGGPTPPFTTSSLIWYQDSFAIEEIKLVKFNTDSKGVQTRNDEIEHYTFIDLRLHTLYDYSSFSDTAKLIKKISQPDSMFVDGGTNFYYAGKRFRNAPESLPDTTIDQIRYKRIKFCLLEVNPEKVYSIGYLRCDQEDSMFSFEKPYCDSIGCVMLKIETFNKATNEIVISSEYNFLRDTLNPLEITVFDAWKNNAKRISETR